MSLRKRVHTSIKFLFRALSLNSFTEEPLDVAGQFASKASRRNQEIIESSERKLFSDAESGEGRNQEIIESS